MHFHLGSLTHSTQLSFNYRYIYRNTYIPINVLIGNMNRIFQFFFK